MLFSDIGLLSLLCGISIRRHLFLPARATPVEMLVLFCLEEPQIKVKTPILWRFTVCIRSKPNSAECINSSSLKMCNVNPKSQNRPAAAPQSIGCNVILADLWVASPNGQNLSPNHQSSLSPIPVPKPAGHPRTDRPARLPPAAGDLTIQIALRQIPSCKTTLRENITSAQKEGVQTIGAQLLPCLALSQTRLPN